MAANNKKKWTRKLLTLACSLLISLPAYTQPVADTTAVTNDKKPEVKADTLLQVNASGLAYRKIMSSLPPGNTYRKVAMTIAVLDTALPQTRSLGDSSPWPTGDTLTRLLQAAQKNLDDARQARSVITNWQKIYQQAISDMQQLAGAVSPDNDTLSPAGQDVAVQIAISLPELITTNDSFGRLAVKADTLLQQYSTLLVTLQEHVSDDRLMQAGRKEEVLWSAPQSYSGKEMVAALRNNYRDNEQVRKFVNRKEWGARVALVLLSAGFFFWLYKNYRKASTANIAHPRFLPAHPLAVVLKLLMYTVVFILMCLPVIEPGLPPVILSWMHGALLVFFLLFLKPQMRVKYRVWWLAFVVLYSCTVLVNTLLTNALPVRIVALALNIIAILGLFRINRYLHRSKVAKFFSKSVFLTFVVVTVIAMLTNIYGKTTITALLNLAAIAGITQYACVYCFRKLINSAMELQFSVAQAHDGVFRRLNRRKTLLLLNRLLYIFGIYSWFLVMFINTGKVDAATGFIDRILALRYSWGSISLSLGNLLWCIVVLVVANWLQKNLPLFFEAPVQSFQQSEPRRSSRIALLRLLIIIIAFFAGISALGLSMDKLTVIIGALTVGIGLGLQNIFNNFVSGVILIFEKPFRVGDYIELADKKGRVKDIGIRSSILLTREGAELIIPNGDLLSGRVVNWSVSEGDIQSSFTVKLNTPEQAEQFKQIIREEVAASDFTREGEAGEIFYDAVTPESITLRVNCRIASIYNEQLFKSDLLQQLSKRAAEQGMAISGN